jgi:hypothetical protein
VNLFHISLEPGALCVPENLPTKSRIGQRRFVFTRYISDRLDLYRYLAASIEITHTNALSRQKYQFENHVSIWSLGVNGADAIHATLRLSSGCHSEVACRSYISKNYIKYSVPTTTNHNVSPSSSSKIPRLVKHMVSVAANTLSLEYGREAQVLRNLIFRNDIVRTFGLTDNKFTDLQTSVSIELAISWSTVW